jgi:arsenate reductase
MEIKTATEKLAALGNESRLAIFRLLVEAGPAGLSAGALGRTLDLAGATASFHFAHLSRVGLIESRRDGRSIIYSACYPAMDELLAFLTHNCCQGSNCLPLTSACDSIEKRRPPPLPDGDPQMNDRIYNVLFLCTGNSARSILAEALLNHLGKERFRAYSAGSRPTGTVNPYARELLERQHLPTAQLRSKSWDEFASADAPRLDFIFTVCDNAAGEVCPVWPGQPMTAHWGVEDPAAVGGDDEARREAVMKASIQLKRRIELFLALPIDKLDAMALQDKLDGIGREKN